MPRDEILIAEMIEAAEQAAEALGGLEPDALGEDRLRLDALLWNLAVLGEAASQVSNELKRSNPQVPWHRPTQLRNRIIHGYWEVDLDIVSSTVHHDLPGLIAALKSPRA